ncbi:MAG: acyl-CoA desaturase [Bacteriovoracia bacterium]
MSIHTQTQSKETPVGNTVDTLIPKKFSWINVLFFVGLYGSGIALSLYYVFKYGVKASDLLIFFVMYALTAIAVTAGYHRYFSHRAFKAHPVIEYFFAIFGAAAVQNNLLVWCSEHRYHHLYTDTDADPYSAKKGFWWSHIGWLFFEPIRPRQLPNVLDLKKNPVVEWQVKYFYLLLAVFGFGLPAIVGLIFDRPFGGLVWGGFIRVIVGHQATCLVNSAAHFFGSQPHTTRYTARNSFLVALLTSGEGYHNFHHAYPSDYRNGHKWYHWDPTKWFIVTTSLFGLSRDLRRVYDR